MGPCWAPPGIGFANPQFRGKNDVTMKSKLPLLKSWFLGFRGLSLGGLKKGLLIFLKISLFFICYTATAQPKEFHPLDDFGASVPHPSLKAGPKGLRLLNSNENDLSVEWTPSEGAIYYHLFLTSQEDSPLEKPSFIVKAPGHFQRITGLEGPTRIYLRVVSIGNSGQQSSPSAPLLIDIRDPSLPQSPPLKNVTKGPKFVTFSVSVSEIHESGFRLSWTPSPQASNYEIFLASNNRFESGVPSYRTQATSQNVEGLASLSNYYVKILALGPDGQMGSSEIIKIKTKGSIEGLSGQYISLNLSTPTAETDASTKGADKDCEDPHHHREWGRCVLNQRACEVQPSHSSGGTQTWLGRSWGECQNYDCSYGYFKNREGQCHPGCRPQRISWFHTKVFQLHPEVFCSGEVPGLKENEEFVVSAEQNSKKGYLGRGSLKVRCKNSELSWKDPNFSEEEWAKYILLVAQNKPVTMSCANDLIPLSNPTLKAYCSTHQTPDVCQANPIEKSPRIQACHPLMIQLRDGGLNLNKLTPKNLSEVSKTTYKVEILTSLDHFQSRYDISAELGFQTETKDNSSSPHSKVKPKKFGFKILATREMRNQQIKIIFTSLTLDSKGLSKPRSAELQISVKDNESCDASTMDSNPALFIIGPNFSGASMVSKGRPL